MTAPLSPLLIEPLVRRALLEDLGRAGDITTDSIVPPAVLATLSVNARQSGVVAGLDLVFAAYRLIDPAIKVTVERGDGARLDAGSVIAVLEGPARGLLTGERVALNFLCHLSGIATATATIVDAIGPYRTRVTCTRKTTPGLRTIEKYAVRVGGGANHRFGLDDAILIKDNHIAIAGGIRPAVERARAAVGHLVKIELEVDSLAQLDEALALPIDAVLLDNMTLQDLSRSVAMVNGKLVTEASGQITAETAPAIAATGVDLISVGWLTHSVPILDIGLDAVS